MELLATAFFIDSLSVYKNLRKDPIIQCLYRCIINLYTTKSIKEQLKAVQNYTKMCRLLYESEFHGCLADYIFDLALHDINIFSLSCAKNQLKGLDGHIIAAAKHDLKTLCSLSILSERQLKSAFKNKFVHNKDLIDLLPSYSISHKKYLAQGDWSENIQSIADFYLENGVGDFAKFHAFIYSPHAGLQPVADLDKIQLRDLFLYEKQRQAVSDNIKALLAGMPYHHILLYGDRGTGKSSTIKAIANTYANRKLRIVELSSAHLMHLGDLLKILGNLPLKFIVYIDDLSFEESDSSYNILKAALEGSVNICPSNTVICATSNRRHLVKETFSSRTGDSLHLADTIDDYTALSERFGLIITFMKPSKDNYLKIVNALAKERHLPQNEQALFKGAEQYALEKGTRSPRIAKQYINSLERNALLET